MRLRIQGKLLHTRLRPRFQEQQTNKDSLQNKIEEHARGCVTAQFRAAIPVELDLETTQI